jgi:hypothetical protein
MYQRFGGESFHIVETLPRRVLYPLRQPVTNLVRYYLEVSGLEKATPTLPVRRGPPSNSGRPQEDGGYP